jgi:beta-phosphoglucomutase
MHAEGFAVLWDMDGTLVDTAELHFAAWVRLFEEEGHSFTRDDFAATFGKRNPEIFDQLHPGRYSREQVAELGDRKEEYYRRATEETGVQLLPGARALLEGLHAAGFRQAVGSSAPRGNLELILRLTGTRQLFEAVVTSEDVRRGKPDPEVFLTAAAKVSTPPPRCVVMEDAVAGVQAGRAGGMKTVAITFVGHHPEETLRAAGADLVVPTLEAVSVNDVRRLLGA